MFFLPISIYFVKLQILKNFWGSIEGVVSSIFSHIVFHSSIDVEDPSLVICVFYNC